MNVNFYVYVFMYVKTQQIVHCCLDFVLSFSDCCGLLSLVLLPFELLLMLLVLTLLLVRLSMEFNNVLKTSSTLSPVRADVSINEAVEPWLRHSLTSLQPSSYVTRRLSFKSVLLPIKIKWILEKEAKRKD